MKDFSTFEDKIGISFNNKDLLKQAFIHRSYINENQGVVFGHNERLEFLGDAVLELVTTEELYARFPSKPEGELTSIRAALVNTNSISDAARNLGANEYLLLSKGEAKDTGKARSYILANTFEAIVGAIYLDSGYENSKKFIANCLFDGIEKIVREKTYIDSKSLVQEKAQEVVGVTPSYEVVSEVGPDHDKNFTIAIYFGEEKVATGKGKSKQEAEQDAARNALVKKKWI
ncbi:MAG: ribonuclease III [Candidatus Paceibacterota bacterium]